MPSPDSLPPFFNFFYYYYSFLASQYLLGTILILQAYSKSRNLTGLEAAICRYLPLELAQLLAVFISYIRPIQGIFTTILAPQDKKEDTVQIFRTYLFVKSGKRMADGDIRDAFTRTMFIKGIQISFSGNR